MPISSAAHVCFLWQSNVCLFFLRYYHHDSEKKTGIKWHDFFRMPYVSSIYIVKRRVAGHRQAKYEDDSRF